MKLSASDLFIKYKSAVIYVAVIDKKGDHSIGSAFHVGEGIFVTAKHVVENVSITELGEGYSTTYKLKRGPFLHPDPNVDVACFEVHEPNSHDIPIIPLGGHLDDWLSPNIFVLDEVLVMGFPPIPTSDGPYLVASRGEVNAFFDSHDRYSASFVVSTIARGGFSGGPAISCLDFALGVVTQSLISNPNHPTEIGFTRILSIEPIYHCLEYHNMIPIQTLKLFPGLFDEKKEEN